MSGTVHRDVRSRVAPIVSGGAIAIATGWYTAGGSRALWGVSIALIVLAILFRRGVLTTARSIIWTGVGLLIVLLAANIERIVPPDDIYSQAFTFLYDRVVTIALVPAFVALFMRPGRAAATMTISGLVPMLILVLARDEFVTGRDTQHPWIVWIAVAMFLLVGQAHNIARPRDSGAPRLSPREVAGRVLYLVVAIGLAFLIAIPSALLMREGAQWLHGKRLFARLYQRDYGAYYLSLAAPPGGFAGQLRPVLSIDAPHAPGYLRQNIYRDLLSNGSWAQRAAASGALLMPRVDDRERRDSRIRYELPASGADDQRSVDWRIRVMGPRWRFSAALPQRVHALQLDEATEVTLDPDDKIGWRGGVSPATYQVSTPFSSGLDSFAPVGEAVAPVYPEVSGDPPAIENTYLKIPGEYLPDVEAWLAQVADLKSGDSPFDTMQAIVHHFHHNFRYRIEGPPSGPSGDLRAFMKDRQGHCTLFATAATLMLRASGIPARMVGGYLVTDRHPLTGEWMVRVRDGHAWCEAWDEQAGGWRRVEATAPGGLPVGFAPPGKLRALLEAIRMGARDFVEWARNFNPVIWLAETSATVYLWMEEFLATTTGQMSMAVMLILTAVYLVWRKRKRLPRDEQARVRMMLTGAMTRLSMHLTPARAQRLPHETWAEWQTRTLAEVPPGKRESLGMLIEQYQSLRYANQLDPYRARAWIARARSFK